MLRDVYWRQYPIDLLSDDKMAYIESLMPEEYRYAPYMFYITALKLADDNGIFDLEDGIIFARLMRVKSRALVFQIANLMRQHKVLYRLSDDTTLMQIADWSYSDKDKSAPRTAEQRREIIAKKIANERARKAAFSQEDFTTDGCAGKCNDIPQSEAPAGKCNAIPQEPAAGSTAPKAYPVPDNITMCKTCEAYNAETKCCTDNRPNACKEHLEKIQEAAANAPRRDFFCADDDKNAKNVGNIQTDNTIHSTDNTVQEVHTTHTQTNTQQLSGYGPIESPPPDNCQTNTAVAEKQNTSTQKPTEMQTPNDATSGEEISTLAAQALQITSVSVEEDADSELFAYLEDFFVKNCLGFDKKKAAYSLNQLCEKIKSVSDEVNPPVEVAGVLCSEFKKMCDGQREKYWKGQALLPSYMIKTRCWMELMQYAGKILATNSASNKFTQSWEKTVAEYEAEKGQISDAVREEYLKYNIDPDAPNANYQLLSAKSREQEEMRKAKEVEDEAAAAEESEHGFEIF